MNPSVAHAELIATFKRAEADAAHKFGLIKAAAQKGPKAIQAAAETAAKATKRRDSYAKKLDTLGVKHLKAARDKNDPSTVCEPGADG